MGGAIAVRTDYTNEKLRRLAQRAQNAAQTCRLLAIAAVLDGASREDAAKIGGMDRQTLRDWVLRYNDRGPDGLINIPSPGAPAKLDAEHKAFLARIVARVRSLRSTAWCAGGRAISSCCCTRNLGYRCRTIRSIALSWRSHAH